MPRRLPSLPQRRTTSPAGAPRGAAGASELGEVLRGGGFLQEHANDLVLFVRLEDGRILEASASAVAAYGYSREQLLAASIFDLRAEPTRDATAAQMRAATDGGVVFEAVHRRRDGSTFPVEVSSRGGTFEGEQILVSVVRDISDRKRAEAELVRARAHLQAIVDNIVEGVIVADLEGNPLEWNDAAARLHGFASKQDCPRTRAELQAAIVFHAEDGTILPADRRPIARILAGERLQDMEVDVRRANSSELRSFSFAGKLVLDQAGQPTMAVVTLRDTTERKLAVQRLAAEREHLTVTLQSIGDGVIVTDERARVTMLNDVAARMSGWTAGEAVGRPVEEVFRIVQEGTREPAVNPVFRVLEQGSVVGLANHTALLSRDGREVPIADSGAPIRGSNGRVSGVVLVFRDQSEERRAQQAVLASQERFRLAFETIPDALVLTRVDDGRFVMLNEGFTRILGWSQAEVLGRTGAELSIWEEPDQRARLVRTLAERGSAHDFPVELRAKDGRIVPGLVTARLMELRGERLLLAVLRDITDAKRAEAEREVLQARLRQAAKLEAIGQLAGGIAHDFNNLLTVILASTDELRSEVAAALPACVGLVDEVEAAGVRARDLTRQLLAFARKQIAAPVSLNLGSAVLGCERLLRRILREDVELRVTTPTDLWNVRCDPGQVEQVIFNLAVNARDAMPEGGTLAIELSNLVVDEARAQWLGGITPGQYVRLLVRDSGCGMTPEVRERIFEPFFTTKGPGKGSGLGLATVYGIVKQSAGFVTVHSQPGAGAAFEICFPRTADEPALPRPSLRQERTGGSERILLVEDDDGVRQVVTRTLRAAGYEVLVAGDAAEALQLVRGGARPSLVVTDVVMPGHSGLVLAEELRRSHPDLKVLFMSGYAPDILSRDGAVELGIELLPKPFTAAALLDHVRSLIDGEPRSSSASAPPPPASTPPRT